MWLRVQTHAYQYKGAESGVISLKGLGEKKWGLVLGKKTA